MPAKLFRTHFDAHQVFRGSFSARRTISVATPALRDPVIILVTVITNPHNFTNDLSILKLFDCFVKYFSNMYYGTTNGRSIKLKPDSYPLQQRADYAHKRSCWFLVQLTQTFRDMNTTVFIDPSYTHKKLSRKSFQVWLLELFLLQNFSHFYLSRWGIF